MSNVILSGIGCSVLTGFGGNLEIHKCSFTATTIYFLSFAISPDGMAPDCSKVAAIADTSTPPNSLRNP